MNESTKRMAILIGAITSMFWSFNMRARAEAEQRIGSAYNDGSRTGYRYGLEKAEEMFRAKEQEK